MNTAQTALFDEAPVFTMPKPFTYPENAGRALAKWAYENLRVPDGPLAGHRLALDDWFVAAVDDFTQPGVRELGVSIARKNAKTSKLCVFILAHVATGAPFYRPAVRIAVASETGKLAKEAWRACKLISEASGLRGVDFRKTPIPGAILGPSNCEVEFLAADRATGQARGCDLAIIDEAGLLREKDRELWGSMYSSISGRDGRFLAVGIAADGPMFRDMKTRAETDPAVRFIEYAAAPDAEIMDVKAWHAANPGLASGIKSMDYMKDAARKALASPSDAALFKSHDLNMSLRPTRMMICEVADWTACITEELPERSGGCVVGFDIGGSASMTAAVAIWPLTGRLEAWAAFGDTPELKARSEVDYGVQSRLYETMAERGELWTYPGRVTPCAEFLEDVAAHLEGEKIIAAGADRFRKAEVEDVLTKAGLNWPMEWKFHGMKAIAGGAHDIRAFSAASSPASFVSPNPSCSKRRLRRVSYTSTKRGIRASTAPAGTDGLTPFPPASSPAAWRSATPTRRPQRRQ